MPTWTATATPATAEQLRSASTGSPEMALRGARDALAAFAHVVLIDAPVGVAGSLSSLSAHADAVEWDGAPIDDELIGRHLRVIAGAIEAAAQAA